MAGLFRFTRVDGDHSQPLTAYYSISGAATPDDDFEELSGSATFAAGASTVGAGFQWWRTRGFGCGT